MDDTIKIISLNCRGLADTKKRRDVLHYLRQKKCEVYFLQDVHIEEKLTKYVTAEWGFKAYFSPYTSNSRGVAILFNNTFEFKVLKVIRGKDGNFLIITIETNKQKFNLVNIYGPNKDEPDFYKNLKEKIKNLENLIIAGDFNLVLDPSKDYYNYKHINNSNSKQVVEDMTFELDLCDIWRELNPENLRYTWRKQNPFQQSRLDFFLVSESLVPVVHDADITHGYRSDHSMITLTLKFSKEKSQRKTLWKHNSSLLKDKKYVDEINELIDNLVSEYAILPQESEDISNIPLSNIQLQVSDETFLDFILMKIRSKTIAYATMKKKETHKEEKELTIEIEALEATKQNQNDIQALEEKQARLESIRERRMEGVLLRSRARYVAEGEKITKYFCNMEKRNYISKNMSKIVDHDGNTLTSNKDIAQEVNWFYQKLYQRKKVEQCDLSELVTNIPQLCEEETKELEGEITLSEAATALKNMKNMKSPGSDGFTVEFFKMFWCKLGIFVVRSLNSAYRKGELSSVQKEGIVTCLPKGDKPREFIKNWRPISLLNVVYKIGSTCIANRIKKVLPKLINEDQTGFISGRYIGDNIRLIYDLIAHLDGNNLPGLLLNIDFEKAFDSLDWGFMHKVLEAFGFGRGFRKWVSTFYKNIKSTVVVNGNMSQWFSIERGCRQGDPISPYLFILCVEILAIMVRENEDIRGITINNIEHKLSQYADDTEFILEGDRRSFETCIEIIDQFGRKSGLFMNNNKTSIIWLGSRKNSNVKYLRHLDMDWNPPKFKILGVWFTNDLKNCENLNYSEKFLETKKIFFAWTKRCITTLGRVAILKSLILSKLIHLWLLLPKPPEDFMITLQKMCYVFVWNEKPDKISRKISNKSIKEGGIGIPNLKSLVLALKVTWLRKLTLTNHKWKSIAVNDIPRLKRIELFGPNIKPININYFWKEVFTAYHTLYYKVNPNNVSELLAEPICYNERIKIGKKCIEHRCFSDNEVFCIGHFLRDDGDFFDYEEFTQIHGRFVNFVTYFGCIQAMKTYIRKCKIQIFERVPWEKNVCSKKLMSVPKGSKPLYDILVTDEARPNCCEKWETKLNQNINWPKCFQQVHILRDVNLRWFQLRIIHRILGTNVVLKEMGLSADEKCGLCGDERDSIEHMFWDCDVAQVFWMQFVNLVKQKCDNAHTLRLSKCLVILGIDDNIKTDTIFCFILLLAKKYIYACKLEKCLPSIDVFKRKLSSRYKIENYNSILEQTQHTFKVKWLSYRQLCTSEP